MHSTRLLVACAGAAVALGTGAAQADTMHPTLGAKLSGMGEHGVVNLQSNAAKGRLCWTFDVDDEGHHAARRSATRPAWSSRSSARRTRRRAARRCRRRRSSLIESKPGSYAVWVDTKGHPGDLRGKLFAGMAHM